MLYRRFRAKTNDPQALKNAERVIEEKNLSREDLLLLFEAIELNSNIKSQAIHAPEFDNGVLSQTRASATDS